MNSCDRMGHDFSRSKTVAVDAFGTRTRRVRYCSFCGTEKPEPRFRKVAAGDYETADGRYRMWRIPDVRPPAWNVEDVETYETVVDGAASMADAIAIFEQATSTEGA